LHPTEDGMSTTSSALDQPTTAAPAPKPPRDKVMRIAAMTEELLDEVRTQTLDTTGLKRLRTIDTQIIGELLTALTPDLREELQRLALPLTRDSELSGAELRLAHAQLGGWLQGLLRTAQTALSDPHAASATSPNDLDQPHVERRMSTSCPPDDAAPDEDKSASRSVRQTLITAITMRIAQRRLTAAQAAAVLHLTGPRVTQLLQANIDEFTLDELVNLLPALHLTIQIVPEPTPHIERSRPNECAND
jgi:predicted XRE-type DNA-binding protein